MTNLLVGLAVFVWMLSRQLTARPLRERSTILWILLAVGVVETGQQIKADGSGARDVALVALSLAVGAALAFVRSRTIRIWSTPEGMFRQGSWLTAVLWLVGLGQHLLIDLFVHDHALASSSLLAYIGLVLLVQRLALLHRAGVEGHRRPAAAVRPRQ